MSRKDLTAKTAKMASTISDPTKRDYCVAAAYAFAHKYLKDDEVEKIFEAIEMTDMGTMLVEHTVMEIARKMLKRGTQINIIAEDTGLDESTVQQLKDELKNE